LQQGLVNLICNHHLVCSQRDSDLRSAFKGMNRAGCVALRFTARAADEPVPLEASFGENA
jgi:hypothetical protein